MSLYSCWGWLIGTLPLTYILWSEKHSKSCSCTLEYVQQRRTKVANSHTHEFLKLNPIRFLQLLSSPLFFSKNCSSMLSHFLRKSTPKSTFNRLPPPTRCLQRIWISSPTQSTSTLHQNHLLWVSLNLSGLQLIYFVLRQHSRHASKCRWFKHGSDGSSAAASKLFRRSVSLNCQENKRINGRDRYKLWEWSGRKPTGLRNKWEISCLEKRYK